MTAPLWTPAGHAAAGRPDLAEVRRLEDLSARSWPPLQTASLGGWQLRAAGGVTRRINSAWPRRAATLTTAQLLAATRTWYARQGLPASIQLSPTNEPPDLADALTTDRPDAEKPADRPDDPDAPTARPEGGDDPTARPDGRGAEPGEWTVGGETVVLEGPLTAAPAPGVRVEGWPGEDWWAVARITAAHHFAGARGETALAVLQRISKPTAFAVAVENGVPVAVGRGVVDGRHLGVFSMGTLPGHRGRGHGRRVLGALGDWAAGLGATSTWLQVETGNVAAQRLYAGLAPVYSYAYATFSSSSR